MCWACCGGSANPVFPLFVGRLLGWPFPLFDCFAPGFGFVVSLGLSRPVGSAGVGGHRWWAGVEEGVLALFFFCYGWPLGHREASNRVMLEFA